ncbi:MAG: hypothetical protein IJQ73_13015 [Kiritimatiellae bacterium]|nr:hypothetical protein [Kiritimatiellia bacterium]
MLGVLSKINPWTILLGHFGTFGDAEGRGRWKDAVLFYLVPAVGGALVWRADKSFNIAKCADAAVTVLAIFIPLAFSVLVELFALMDREKVRGNPRLEKLARHLYWNVSYGIFAATVALCALAAKDFLGVGNGKIVEGVFVAVALHFLLTALMVGKRFARLMDPERSR